MAEDLEIAKSTKVKLSEMSCPFTWEFLQKAVTMFSLKDADGILDPIEKHETEFFLLIYNLVKCFECVVSFDISTAHTELRGAEECLERIRESCESYNIIRTIEHIVYAAKCHFLYITSNDRELENILQNIVDISNFTVQEHGALQGFIGLAYSLYQDWGLEKSTDAAIEATEKDKHNAVWHYLLGSNLRRKRRLISVQSSPSSLEKESLEKAFMLSKSPTFGISYAQMKLESAPRARTYERIKLEKQLMVIYDSVLDSNTKKCGLLLGATLGYLRLFTSDSLIKAERCLDAVDKLYPSHSAALHYRGLLYKKRKNYEEALKFFKLSADLHNYPAEINYVELGWKIGSVNPVEHLLNVQTKYTNLIHYRQQTLYLQIATSYVCCNKASNAAEYYLKAIDIDPDSVHLTHFFKFLNCDYHNGVYHFLQHDFLPSCPRARLDPLLLQVVDQLHERCQKHSDKGVEDIEEQLRIVKI